jgi:HtrA serine peptidase 2
LCIDYYVCFDDSVTIRIEFVGIIPLSSYRVSPVPSSDISKETSGEVHDGSKPCGCFGRDTIANAAAKVGPSVVNISIPQGFLTF